MKSIFTTAVIFFSITAFAQVGINNTSPKATLDITAKTTDGSKPEGLIIPQLTGDQIRAATTATPTPAYGSNQKGLMIYATAADSAPVGATASITAPGYYYFDGSAWQKVITGSVANTDLATGVGGIYKGSGSLSGNTTVTQGANTLAFTSTASSGTSHFTLDGTTLNVDAVNNRVGIGVAAPKSFLQVSTLIGGASVDAGIFSINNCWLACSQSYTARNIVLNNLNNTNSVFASIDFVPSTDPTAPSGSSIQGIDRDATNNYAGVGFWTRNASGYGQRMVVKSAGNVGIGTSTPHATLDISAVSSGTSPEGIIAPRLSLAALQGYNYGGNQTGAIVYVTPATGTPTGQTANVTAAGYYFFDGSAWQKILNTSSGDTTNDAWTNDTTNTMVKIGTKADGTARAAGTDVVVKDDGKVGIGTSTPSTNLDVIASGNRQGITVANSDTTAGTVTRLAIGGGTPSWGAINYTNIDNSINSRMSLGKFEGAEYLTVKVSGANAGNVGIRTTDPKTILQVTSPAGSDAPVAAFSSVNCGAGCAQGTARNIVLNNVQTNNSLFASIDFVPGSDPLGDSGASIQGIDRDAANNYAGLSFFTRNATDYASRMVIKSSGNVGIGTSSPSAKLEINSSTAGAIKIVDGTQDADKVLMSDANGVGTWREPASIKATVLGVFPASNMVVSADGGSSPKYTQLYIDLSQGKWIVNAGLTLTNTTTNSSYWLHMFLSTSTTSSQQTGFTHLGPAGNSTYYAGIIAPYPSFGQYNFLSGSSVINVTAASVRIYLLIENKATNYWSSGTASNENYFYAVPVN